MYKKPSCYHLRVSELTDVFNLSVVSDMFAQVRLQCPTKELDKDLKADLGESGVISSFGLFISDEAINPQKIRY